MSPASERTLVIIAVLALCSAVLAQGPATVEPRAVFQWHGLTVVSPDQAGWALAASDEARIVFERRNERELLRASVSIMKTKVAKTDEDLLAGLERLKQEEWKGPFVPLPAFSISGAGSARPDHPQARPSRSSSPIDRRRGDSPRTSRLWPRVSFPGTSPPVRRLSGFDTLLSN